MMRLLMGIMLALFVLQARAQDSAPLFAASFPDLQSKPVALSGYRGKPLIVNFWARWCAPCREEIPELNAVWQAHRAKGLVVLGIGLEDNLENVRDFAKAYEMGYPILLAKAQGIDLMKALGNPRAGLPFTLALDREGRIVLLKLGKISRAELDAAAAAILK